MAPEETPYVGPKPFDEADQERFFGREEETAEIVSLVYSQPQVLLYAESGAGKTSLVNAGVAPQLRQDGQEVLPVARVRPRRRVADPRTASGYMLEALSSIDPSRPPESLGGATLQSFLEARTRPSAGDQRTLRVVFFDQLEEIFIPVSDRFQQEQESFFVQVAEAVKSDPLLRVVFVVREDNLPRLDSFAPLLPEGLGVRCRLDRLRPDRALVAVREPLRTTAWQFNDGVAERLVEDLRKMRVETRPGKTEDIVGNFVEPVQLQVVCERLWQSLPAGGGTITFSDLKRYGDVSRALSAFYESALQRAAAESGEDEWKLRVWFGTKLITPAGTRGIVYQGAKETEGIRNQAVKVLEEMHLVRGDYRAGAQWYELTHDRFIGPIQESNHRAQQPARLPTGPGSRLLRILALVGGLAAAVGVLFLPWLALPGTARALLVRMLAVLVAAFLPAWLYVSFLQTRMRPLWDEYVLALFRLRADDYGALPEPPPASRYHRLWEQAGGRADDTSNIYVRKFEATRGRGVLAALRGYGRVTVARQALSVVLLYSLLAGAGWWFVLRPDLLGAGSVLGIGGGGGPWSGLVSALQFGFVGAYLTGLGQIIRDQANDRLSRATYLRVSTRMLVVSLAVVFLHLLVSWAISIQVELILAFLIGIVPEVGVQALKTAVARAFGPAVPSIRSEYPLTDLDGLSIWDQAVLIEEGVEDLHALVTANLVDLFLNTRVPVARLVDWLDQAFLLLHISPDQRRHLRGLGIRTATDLQRAWDSIGPDDNAARIVLAGAMGYPSPEGLVMTEMVLRSFSGHPNFFHVRQFRAPASSEA